MKNYTLILLSFLMLTTLTQCKNTSADILSNDADSRAKTISTLMNNEAYMDQVMDSMRTKHPDALLTTVFIIAKGNRQMLEKMMNKMTDMCKMDTTITEMMVAKTMNMLDDSNLDCCATGKMLMGDKMAETHGNQSDCCRKGKMMTGKTVVMSAADKLVCCMDASKKSNSKVRLRNSKI